MGIKVILVHADDWEGLYVDGFLSEEGHSIDFRTIMEVIENKTVTHWASIEADDKWLNDEGTLPMRLAECKLVEPIPAWTYI